MNMETLMLLLDHDRVVLGEASIRNKTMERVLLTDIGERRFAHELARWQTEGLALRVESERMENHSDERRWHVERISMRDPRFLTALRRWAVLRGCQCVILPSIYTRPWHHLLCLDVDPRQRFEIIMRLRQLDAVELKKAEAALREILHVATTAQRKMVSVLAEDLIRALQKASTSGKFVLKVGKTKSHTKG